MSNSDIDGGSLASMPVVIRTYLEAQDARDAARALSTFTPTAVVIDDGRTLRGHEEIRHWLENASREYDYERTLLGATSTAPGDWLVSNNLTGNFPGGTVDLAYRFVVTDHGEIEQLIIAPDAT